MGDRYQQSIDALTTIYQLDLAAGLTQVLTDGTDTYLYGLGRIGEVDSAWTYYTTDALGSVRQLTDGDGALLLAQSYEPYGSVLNSVGQGESIYGFTGEISDASGLTYLRARYMQPGTGTFISRDTWMGDYNSPLSLNKWAYVEGNPVNLTDPSGYFAEGNHPGIEAVQEHIEDFRENEQFIRAFGLDPVTIAASIAVQSEYRGLGGDWLQRALGIKSSGFGPAQTNKSQFEDYLEDVLQKLNKFNLDDCTLNTLKTYDGQNGDELLEFDPENWSHAIHAMTLRIARSTYICAECTPVDRLIIASMAQNVGFEMKGYIKTNFVNEGSAITVVDWKEFFLKEGKKLDPTNLPNIVNNQRAGKYFFDTTYMIYLVTKNILTLNSLDKYWALPRGVSIMDLDYMLEISKTGQ